MELKDYWINRESMRTFNTDFLSSSKRPKLALEERVLSILVMNVKMLPLKYQPIRIDEIPITREALDFLDSSVNRRFTHHQVN